MAKSLEKILSEGAKLSSEMQEQITEAWNQKLADAREEVTSELREEFARKFKHDKQIFVESVDKFLDDKIRSEIQELAEDKKQLAEARVVYKRKVKEHATLLNSFIAESLAKEVKELHSDKAKMKENFKKLENFLLKQLAEEIREFRKDKNSLVEQRVRMVAEGKKHLADTKQQFISRAAKLVEATINKALNNEIVQFKEDIAAARDNDFGRRIFEAFVGEYMTSYLNEGTEVSKLNKVLEAKQQQIESLTESLSVKSKLVESAEVKLSAAKNRITRDKKLHELLAPLAKDKRAVMKDLLESTQTKDLDAAFKKYIPAVLNESKSTKYRHNANKQNLSESARLSEKTGDRAKTALQNEISRDFDNELAEIKALAGLK